MYNNIPKIKKVKPFLQWIRSKRQLIHTLEYYYPIELKNNKIKYYYEPFLGGGSVFFDIVQKYNIEHAYLYDINDDLILTYKVIQSDVFKLIDFLTLFKNTYIKYNQYERTQLFEQLKKDFNNNRNDIDYSNYSYQWISRAAQFIFLNQTSKYGFFRINKNGTYNDSNNIYNNPTIFSKSNLIKINALFKKVTFINGDYSNFLYDLKPNSFIYLDPPSISNKNSYDRTTYPKYQFNSNNHLKLYNTLNSLKKKYKFMLTTLDPKNFEPNNNFFINLYKNYNITNILHHKYNCINNELIITNY